VLVFLTYKMSLLDLPPQEAYVRECPSYGLNSAPQEFMVRGQEYSLVVELLCEFCTHMGYTHTHTHTHTHHVKVLTPGTTVRMGLYLETWAFKRD
jgi:hypothetical protein